MNKKALQKNTVISCPAHVLLSLRLPIINPYHHIIYTSCNYSQHISGYSRKDIKWNDCFRPRFCSKAKLGRRRVTLEKRIVTEYINLGLESQHVNWSTFLLLKGQIEGIWIGLVRRSGKMESETGNPRNETTRNETILSLGTFASTSFRICFALHSL